MAQVARNLTDPEDGFLRAHHFVICDRDAKFTAEFRRILQAVGVRVIRTPRQAPNGNAHAERFVLSIKSECLKLTAPGERRIVGNGEVETHDPEQRVQEPFGLAQREMGEEPQGQSGLDGEIRVPPLPTPPAAPAGRPGSDRFRGHPHRHIAAANEGPVVGRPDRHAIFRRVRGMGLRLPPCRVAPAEGHEKCRPNRLTPAGSSCNNAPSVLHCTDQYANNRAEASHQPTRQRERQMRCFTSAAQLQRFASVHGIVQNLFRVGRHLLRSAHHRLLRTRAFVEWDAVTCAC